MILFFSFLGAQEVSLPANMTIPIKVEHAVTDEQLAWGFMQRRELPENHGMTFTYPMPAFQRFWMFNCHIHLSVAFLDEQKIIRQIAAMRAHPEKMDPQRPVRSYAEMAQYSLDEPIMQFYMAHAVKSTIRSRYALEMNFDWFQNHKVAIGDAVWWDTNSSQAYVIRTIDLSSYRPLTEPLALTFPDAAFRSLQLPQEPKFYQVQFFEGSQVVDKRIVSHHQPVLCYRKISSILVTPLK